MKKLLYNLSVFSNILNKAFGHNKTKRLYTADFAEINKLKALTADNFNEETTLLMGKDKFGQVLRVRPTQKRRELGNFLAVAVTRGGKGLLATSQLLAWKGSVIVNDIKGDLFTQTAGFRSTLGPVYVVSPTGVGHRFDPLSGQKHRGRTAVLRYPCGLVIGRTIVLLFKADEGEGAIFTQRATVMLTQLFLAAREEGRDPFPYIRQLIRSGLTSAAERLEAVSPELATQFLEDTFERANLSDRFLLSAWGTLSARLRPLLTETVIRSLAGTDFEASELMRGEKTVTVYLHWPERDLLALSPLVRLLWGSLIDDLVDTYDRHEGQNCRPVLLLVDEAGRTAIPSLADQATTKVSRTRPWRPLWVCQFTDG